MLYFGCLLDLVEGVSFVSSSLQAGYLHVVVYIFLMQIKLL